MPLAGHNLQGGLMRERGGRKREAPYVDATGTLPPPRHDVVRRISASRFILAYSSTYTNPLSRPIQASYNACGALASPLNFEEGR